MPPSPTTQPTSLEKSGKSQKTDVKFENTDLQYFGLLTKILSFHIQPERQGAKCTNTHVTSEVWSKRNLGM